MTKQKKGRTDKCKARGNARTRRTEWANAVTALHAAGVEDYTEEFAHDLRENGWSLAYANASFEANNSGRALYVDLYHADIAPDRLRALGLITMLSLDVRCCQALVTVLAINQADIPEYDALCRKLPTQEVRLLLFHGDSSTKLTAQAACTDVAGRIDRTEPGRTMACCICLDDYSALSFGYFKCSHAFCNNCNIELLKHEHRQCPLCRAEVVRETEAVCVEAELQGLRLALRLALSPVLDQMTADVREAEVLCVEAELHSPVIDQMTALLNDLHV